MLIDSTALREVIQNRLDQAEIIIKEAAANGMPCFYTKGVADGYEAALLDITRAEAEVRRVDEIALDAVTMEIATIQAGRAA